jgi:hypothetical protein
MPRRAGHPRRVGRPPTASGRPPTPRRQATDGVGQATHAASAGHRRRRAGHPRRVGQATHAASGRPPTPRRQATHAASGRPPTASGRPPTPRRQATRKGWPYYTRPLHKPYDTFVYSRATPCGWPVAAFRYRFWGHPLRVACRRYWRGRRWRGRRWPADTADWPAWQG